MTSRNILSAAVFAGVLSSASIATANPCFDDFAGKSMGTVPEESAVVVACWLVRYNAGTVIVNSQGQTVDPLDIPVGADVIFDACYGEDWSFTASRIEWVTSPEISVCTDSREGVFFGMFSTQNTLNVNCWPVRYDENTTFQNEDGDPMSPEQIVFGDQLAAIGCFMDDGFTLLADIVVVATDGTVLLDSTSDVELSIRSKGGYVVDNVSAKSVVIHNTSGVNPTLRLEVGKRYMFTHANFAAHPFQLGSANPFDRLNPFGAALSFGGASLPFENDADVDFVETESEVFFTLTPRLAQQLSKRGVPAWRDGSGKSYGRIEIVRPKR